MKTISTTTKGAILSIAVIAFGLVGARAIPSISISVGNPGNAGTDNVLFGDQTGTLVKGHFSGGNANIVDFTSSSGDGGLIANGGQATIQGGAGIPSFRQLSFWVENSTFTKAILNLDAVNNGQVDGNVMFAVTYVTPLTTESQTLTLNWNGQNFFGIEVVANGALITEISLTTTIDLADANQFRIGGIAAYNPPPPVPDGGSTLMLIGLTGLALGAVSRRIRRLS